MKPWLIKPWAWLNISAFVIKINTSGSVILIRNLPPFFGPDKALRVLSICYLFGAEHHTNTKW